jgi:ribonuclease R
MIELPDALVTGMIHVSALADDFFTFDPVRLCFTGRKSKQCYKVGDELQVIVARVDAYKRQLDFAPVSQKAKGESKSFQRVERQRDERRSERPRRGRR